MFEVTIGPYSIIGSLRWGGLPWFWVPTAKQTSKWENCGSETFCAPPPPYDFLRTPPFERIFCCAPALQYG